MRLNIHLRHNTDIERPLASHIQRSNKISRNALGFDEEKFRE